MYFIKTIAALAVAVVMVCATPVVNKRAVCCPAAHTSRTVADRRFLYRRVISSPKFDSAVPSLAPHLVNHFPRQQKFY